MGSNSITAPKTLVTYRIHTHPPRTDVSFSTHLNLFYLFMFQEESQQQPDRDEDAHFETIAMVHRQILA